MENDEWTELTVLFRKWERISSRRKQSHYKSSNKFGWLNKLFTLPIILISTILGSLSFIHPSFIDQSSSSSSRLLYQRNLQEPTCMWEKYNSFITDPPYCDNAIIKYQDDFYKSTLADVDELVCDRNVNWIEVSGWESGGIFSQYTIPNNIISQDDAEVWCIDQDIGKGVFIILRIVEYMILILPMNTTKFGILGIYLAVFAFVLV